MNVETVRKMEHSTERYSFRAHAARAVVPRAHPRPERRAAEPGRAMGGPGSASTETPSSGSPTITDAERADLTKRINAAIDDITAEAFGPLEQEVTGIFSDAGAESEDVDSIANLALLASEDNSALSNSVFEVKRSEHPRARPAGSLHPSLHPQRLPQVLHRCRTRSRSTSGARRTEAATWPRCRQHVVAYLTRRGDAIMTSFLTSFAGLFEPRDTDARRSRSIEIPLIQRDYAQGRTTQDDRHPGATSSTSCTTHSPRASRRTRLRLRRGRGGHAAPPRRPAATHHAVPAALVPGVPQRSTSNGTKRG